jgi:hypothetical protein
MSVLVTLEKWSADYDALFLRRNRADCMMLVLLMRPNPRRGRRS